MGGRDVLPIKRFGRDKTDYGYTRSRMISALTVLLADEAPGTRSRWSYVLLVEEWRRIVAEPENSTHELFRRMCFNALISNLDDHPRNHVFIAKDQDWALSPALRFESFASCQPGAPRSCDGVRGPEHLLRKRKNDVRAGIKMPENMRQAFVRFKTLCDDILGYSKKHYRDFRSAEKLVARIQIASRRQLTFLRVKDGHQLFKRQENRTEQVLIEQTEEFIESRKEICLKASRL